MQPRGSWPPPFELAANLVGFLHPGSAVLGAQTSLWWARTTADCLCSSGPPREPDAAGKGPHIQERRIGAQLPTPAASQIPNDKDTVYHHPDGGIRVTGEAQR